MYFVVVTDAGVVDGDGVGVGIGVGHCGDTKEKPLVTVHY